MPGSLKEVINYHRSCSAGHESRLQCSPSCDLIKGSFIKICKGMESTKERTCVWYNSEPLTKWGMSEFFLPRDLIKKCVDHREIEKITE